VFAFACKTGNFAHPKYVSVSEAFIREKKGAVAYYGASVNTTTDSDVVLEKNIFNKAFNNHHQTLSALINAGLKPFYKSYITNKKAIRNLKSYNLMGDPSLNLNGVEYSFNHVITYSDTAQRIKQTEIVNTDLFTVFQNPNSDDFSIAYTLENNSFVQIILNDMSNKFVKKLYEQQENKAGVYFHNFSLSDLLSGTYVLVYKDGTKTVSSKIIKQ
jgi:hypothetical protein